MRQYTEIYLIEKFFLPLKVSFIRYIRAAQKLMAFTIKDDKPAIELTEHAKDQRNKSFAYPGAQRKG
jgi:hypothetical protein